MTNANDDSNAKLLNAYRMAITAEQDGIADELEDVILSKMEADRELPITISTGTSTNPKVEPSPWWVNPTITKPLITCDTKE